MAFVMSTPTREANYEMAFVTKEPEEAEIALDKFKVFNETLEEILNINSCISDPFQSGKQTDGHVQIELTNTEKRRRQQVMAIKGKKYNSKCADCSCKSPVYIVMNFSIFICSKCCTHHRKLGHQVKSIYLDDFTDNEVEMLQANGNKKSNKKYLHKYKHINNRNNNQQYTFIKNKYFDKLWTKNKNKNKSKKKKKIQKQVENEIEDQFDWDPFKDIDWDVFDDINDNNVTCGDISLKQSETQNIFDINSVFQTPQTPQTPQTSKIQNLNTNDANMNQIREIQAVQTKKTPNPIAKTEIMNIFKIYGNYNSYNNSYNSYYPQQRVMYENNCGYNSNNPFYYRQPQRPAGAQVNNGYQWRYQ